MSWGSIFSSNKSAVAAAFIYISMCGVGDCATYVGGEPKANLNDWDAMLIFGEGNKVCWVFQMLGIAFGSAQPTRATRIYADLGSLFPIQPIGLSKLELLSKRSLHLVYIQLSYREVCAHAISLHFE